jgi:hypothetical protein
VARGLLGNIYHAEGPTLIPRIATNSASDADRTEEPAQQSQNSFSSGDLHHVPQCCNESVFRVLIGMIGMYPPFFKAGKDGKFATR